MIYFLQPAEGGPIKIGFARDIESRKKALEQRYKCSLVLLHSLEGGKEQEAELHQQFKDDRIGRSEQFQPSRAVLDYIDRPLFSRRDPVEQIKDGITIVVQLSVEEAHRLRVEAAVGAFRSRTAYAKHLIVQGSKRDERKGVIKNGDNYMGKKFGFDKYPDP